MAEKWTPIPGYEGRYVVSDRGRLARVKDCDGQEMLHALKPRIDGNGYASFHLYKDSKQKHLLAHRVVWHAFRGPIPAGMEINHKNGVKPDNRLANLELATRSQNMLHGFRSLGFSRNRVRGVFHPKAKLLEKDVREVLKLRAAGVRRYEVARKFNVSPTAIHLIETGHNWSHLTGRIQGEIPAFPSPSGHGSSNARAKLSEADIPKIFAMRQAGMSQRKIASQFGVQQQAIGRILLGQRWGHIQA